MANVTNSINTSEDGDGGKNKRIKKKYYHLLNVSSFQ